MRIKLDSHGNIFSVTPDDSAQTGTLVQGVIPNDFLSTFALGKYSFNPATGLITAVPGWIAPPLAPLP